MDSSNMAKSKTASTLVPGPSAFVDVTIAEDAQLNCGKEIIDQEDICPAGSQSSLRLSLHSLERYLPRQKRSTPCEKKNKNTKRSDKIRQAKVLVLGFEAEHSGEILF
ncbi:MAG: hypothetical protein L6R36_009323 [Xanthoria steineri]|nr:MAG: hypothetical protein L6R36_009323 [Xanthoria steineri]